MTGWMDADRRMRLWRWARVAVGVLIVGVIADRLGGGPFWDGLRRVTVVDVAIALAVCAATTAVTAWRWVLVAEQVGLRIPLQLAYPAYYRSQFLNSTLPGGVVGDLHRGLRMGSDSEQMSKSLRSVVWDRAVGQVVQVVVAAAALLALGSPAPTGLVLLAGASATVAAVGLAARVRRVRLVASVGVASALAVAGHLALFLVAARDNVPRDHGSTSYRVLVPLALLALLAMSVPANIGGWGPREGVAAWAFSAAGLGAAQGVATATTYGVLSLVATSPGLAVLAADWWRGRQHPSPVGEPHRPEPGQLVGVGSSGERHG